LNPLPIHKTDFQLIGGFMGLFDYFRRYMKQRRQARALLPQRAPLAAPNPLDRAGDDPPNARAGGCTIIDLETTGRVRIGRT
jgi:hypothetical protein